MREGCLKCVRKHLSKAEIITHELKDYPKHIRLIVGNLSEAEDEAQKRYGFLSDLIRKERVALLDKWDEAALAGKPDILIQQAIGIDYESLIDTVMELVVLERADGSMG